MQRRHDRSVVRGHDAAEEACTPVERDEFDWKRSAAAVRQRPKSRRQCCRYGDRRVIRCNANKPHGVGERWSDFMRPGRTAALLRSAQYRHDARHVLEWCEEARLFDALDAQTRQQAAVARRGQALQAALSASRGAEREEPAPRRAVASTVSSSSGSSSTGSREVTDEAAVAGQDGEWEVV